MIVPLCFGRNLKETASIGNGFSDASAIVDTERKMKLLHGHIVSLSCIYRQGVAPLPWLHIQNETVKAEATTTGSEPF
jgi:hypothetical protein